MTSRIRCSHFYVPAILGLNRRCALRLLLAGFVNVLIPVQANSLTPSPSKSEFSAAASPTLRGIRARGAIRLGVRTDTIPFSYALDDRFVGYSVDLCQRVVDALRADLKLASLPIQWVASKSVADSLDMLEQGRIDIECGATVSNAARRERVSFTVPHFYSISRVVTSTGSGRRALSDFAGKTVAAVKGSTTAIRLKELIDRKTAHFILLEVDAARDGLALLERGQVAGFSNFEAQLHYWRANQSDPRKFVVIGEAIAMEPVALALPRDDRAFKQRVGVAVSHAMIDGHVSLLYRRWFVQPIPPAGINLEMSISELLRSSLLFPID
jgi:glutamate/aspartate transport system substrate-binding protein